MQCSYVLLQISKIPTMQVSAQRCWSRVIKLIITFNLLLFIIKIKHMRIVLICLLVCGLASMQIAQDDPQRNIKIVKVLAAYSGIGVQESQDGYDYIKDRSFLEVIKTFLQSYKNQDISISRPESAKYVQEHRENIDWILSNAQSYDTLTASQEIDLAQEVIDELDSFYMKVYNITTNNPDKYVGLISYSQIKFAPLESEYDRMRKIFAAPALEDLPAGYQYFHERSWQNTSQFDQDGVIQAIFDLIGTRNKFFVEVGGGSAIDNTNYLRTAKGWNGYLFNSGRYFVDKTQSSMLINQFVSPDQAVSVFKKYDVPKDLDFLSVDIDGNDYWVTKSLLEQYRPAVFSVEFNSNFPATVSASLAQGNPNFGWNSDKVYGVSARAVYELGLEHGYSYVYHMVFTDIFMVRNDLLPANFTGMKLQETYCAFPLHKVPSSIAPVEALKVFQASQNQNMSEQEDRISQRIKSQLKKQLKKELEKVRTRLRVEIQNQIKQELKKNHQINGVAYFVAFVLALLLLLFLVRNFYYKRNKRAITEAQENEMQLHSQHCS